MLLGAARAEVRICKSSMNIQYLTSLVVATHNSVQLPTFFSLKVVDTITPLKKAPATPLNHGGLTLLAKSVSKL